MNAGSRATSSSTIDVTWERLPSAVSYRVTEVDATDRTQAVKVLEPVEGEFGSVEVPELAPVTEHCFTVASQSAAGTRGRPSEPACATTLVPTGNGDLPGSATTASPAAATGDQGRARLLEAGV